MIPVMQEIITGLDRLKSQRNFKKYCSCNCLASILLGALNIKIYAQFLSRQEHLKQPLSLELS